ncbi:hypothetical protein MRX96_043269 [Rhipicephalus microplus]
MQTLTASVFVCSIMVIVAPTPKEKDCEIENLDMYYAITNFLNKISTYKRDVQRISLYEGLLFIECCNVTGLEQLRQYGPVLPHCSSFHPMFEVDIVSDGPIEVVMNWMTYAGMKGTLTVGAQLTKVLSDTPNALLVNYKPHEARVTTGCSSTGNGKYLRWCYGC